MPSEKDIIANLKVEGVEGFKTSIKGAEQATDSLESSIKRMEDSIKTIPEGSKEFKKMTSELEALKVVANSSVDAFENNRTALAAYKKEISGLATVMATLKAEGKQGTQVFKDIQAQFEATKKKAGELSDKIGDINAEIKSLGSDTRGIDNVVRGVTLVANGYQLAAGATAVFGKENKDLAQALIKINGIMAITQSAQQIGTELTREDSIVKQAGVQVTRLWNLALGESTGAIRLFRAALASIGIGLVIAAIYELYTNWDKLKEAIFGATQSLEDFRSKQEEIKKENQKSFEDYETEIKYLVNIKKLTQEQADLKLSIKRKESEEKLKDVYEENRKKLEEYEKAIRAVTFAKDDGLTQSEIDLVRSQQKYIPTQKELIEQRKIAKEAELDYQRAVNERIKTEDKSTKIPKLQKEKEISAARIKQQIEELELITSYDKNSQSALKAQLDWYTQLRATVDMNSQSFKDLTDIIDLLQAKLSGKQEVKIDFQDAFKNIKKLSIDKQPTLFERIFGTAKENETRLEEVTRMSNGALKIVDQLSAYGSQIAGIASQAIQIQADNDIAALEVKRQKGIISQKQFEKESARIKNEAAQKQRAVQIAMATAQIPQAVLSAFISALPFGPIVAGVVAGIAGAFAAAQVAIIASSPLPKFRQGGSVQKRLGIINGKKHEQGGVPIEVEGGEYVIKSESVKKYGVKMLDNINAMKFNPVITHSKIGKRDNRLNENLVTISSYLKQGYKIDSKGNEILKEIRDNMAKKQVYV